MTTTSGLSGSGLQQTPEQWAARGEALSASMARLIDTYQLPGSRSALDVGCQNGSLVDRMAELTGLAWEGIDPGLDGEQRSPAGAPVKHGYADALDYPDASMDVLLFANVYEHVLPERRVASLREMARVLRRGGIVAGQIPNPYFPVESHSRLPLMGWLPLAVQRQYWKLSNVPWDHDFYVVTLKHLRADAAASGLQLVHHENFNYPIDVYPTAVQGVVRRIEPAMRRFPWAWQFVLRRAR